MDRHISTLPAALCVRVMHPFHPSKAEGAGNAGRLAAPSRAGIESTRVSHRRRAETIRHSLHNGVRLIPCSPAIGLCVTVPAQREALSRVHASVEALRPHGFVVHLGIARQSIPKRPSHPRVQRFVTIAIRPLFGRGRACSDDLPAGWSEKFLSGGMDSGEKSAGVICPDVGQINHAGDQSCLPGQAD
jgi:hypothetical protein